MIQVSYVWIFDKTINFSTRTAMAGIFAAALWLTCSLCYVVYSFYNYCTASQADVGLEESEDDASVPTKPGKIQLD